MSKSPPNALLLAELRQRIRHLETPQPWLAGDEHIASASCALDIPEIDHVLPGGGLYRGALHEIAAAGTATGIGHMDATATGFAAFLAARFAGSDGHVLWCRREGSKDSNSRGRYGPNIYGPGLAALGLDTRRLIVARGLSREEVLWAMEEGLASRALCAVLGEPGHLDQTALRRLQLAAENTLTPALLLMPEPAIPTASPAHTRWRVKPIRARVSHHTFPASAPHWRVEMLKCRGIQTQDHQWTITRKKPDTGYEADSGETHRFVVAAGLSRGSRPISPNGANTTDATNTVPFRRSA